MNIGILMIIFLIFLVCHSNDVQNSTKCWKPRVKYVRLQGDIKLGVEWRCRIKMAQSKPTCKFQYQKGNEMKTIPKEHKRRKSSYYSSYYCYMRLPTQSMTLGKQLFRISFFLEDSQGNEFGEFLTSMEDDSLTLSLPTAAIWSPYPSIYAVNGYLMAGKEFTVRCWLVFEGFPSGKVIWLDDNNNSLSAADNEAILHFKYERNPNPKYRCQSKSALGYGTYQDYAPNFAYGPEILSISSSISINQDDVTFNKTKSNLSFEVHCAVPTGDANPTPDFKVIVNNKKELIPSFFTPEDGLYFAVFQIYPDRDGKYDITCVATNSIFPSLKIEKQLTVNVNDFATILISFNDGPSLDNNWEQPVIEGIAYLVKCRIPPSSNQEKNITINMTLICGGRTQITGNDYEITMWFLPNMETDQKKCVCSVDFENMIQTQTSVILKVTSLIKTLNNVSDVPGEKDHDNNSNMDIVISVVVIGVIILVSAIIIIIVLLKKVERLTNALMSNVQQSDLTSPDLEGPTTLFDSRMPQQTLNWNEYELMDASSSK